MDINMKYYNQKNLGEKIKSLKANEKLLVTEIGMYQLFLEKERGVLFLTEYKKRDDDFNLCHRIYIYDGRVIKVRQWILTEVIRLSEIMNKEEIKRETKKYKEIACILFDNLCDCIDEEGIYDDLISKGFEEKDLEFLARR